MSLMKPYRRTCRQLVDGSYANSGHGEYVLHSKYAQDPKHYIRAFLLLQNDLKDLFYYVEPASQNLGCYSFRIHELLLRACVEIEANCKAILLENGYLKAKGDLNMGDYKKIEISHKLSGYEIQVPTWTGAGATRRPFAAWSTGVGLPWYEAYNAAKHDRHASFQKATFEHMLDAIAGCLVILSAQFHTRQFSPADDVLLASGPADGMETGIGEYFRVKFAQWPPADRYGFEWRALAADPDPFLNFAYP